MEPVLLNTSGLRYPQRPGFVFCLSPRGTSSAHNPSDFHVPDSRVNPWNDPLVSHEAGARYSLETASLYGTAGRVAEQVAELRDVGTRHVLCQMSVGYLPHARIVDSMQRFGAEVMPRFR